MCLEHETQVNGPSHWPNFPWIFSHKPSIFATLASSSQCTMVLTDTFSQVWLISIQSASALALVILNLYKQWKKSRLGVQQWLVRRGECSHVRQLLQELHLKDEACCHLWVSKDQFCETLSLVKPYIATKDTRLSFGEIYRMYIRSSTSENQGNEDHANRIFGFTEGPQKIYSSVIDPLSLYETSSKE